MWTEATILSLAPDPRTGQQAQDLAQTHLWSELGQNDLAWWGSCQSKGLSPYQVLIRKQGPKLRCDCPKNQPCKHSLALLLLQARTELPACNPPAWALDYLPQNQVLKPEKSNESKPLSKRNFEYQAGLEYLHQALREVAQHGLEGLEADWWQHAAARLQDLKLSRLANEWRELAGRKDAGDFPKQAGRVLAHAHRLLQLFQLQEQLPSDLQEELEAQLGRTHRKNDLLQRDALNIDTFYIIGQEQKQTEQQNPPLHSRYTYLYNPEKAQWALILDFSPGYQPNFGRNYPVGSRLKGRFYAYPGQGKRVIFEEESVHLLPPLANEAAFGPLADWSWQAVLEAQAEALLAEPFPKEQTLILRGMRLLKDEQEQAFLLDAAGHILPLPVEFGGLNYWKIQALSGGSAISLMGLWDGQCFRPLSALQAGVWHKI